MKTNIIFFIIFFSIILLDTSCSDDISDSSFVSIEGRVIDGETQAPVQDAIVGTSLDSKTATTNAYGDFVLITNTTIATNKLDEYNFKQYTIYINATGFENYEETWNWGGHPAGQIFYLFQLNQ